MADNPTSRDEIEEECVLLTQQLWAHCTGLNAVAVAGAGLNIVMSAAQFLPDAMARNSVAISLRLMADTLTVTSERPN